MFSIQLAHVNFSPYFHALDKNLKIKDRISLLSTTISSIFIISLKKSDTLSDIMEARLYDVDKPLYQTKFRFRVFDTFIMMMHIALVLLIIRKGVMI